MWNDITRTFFRVTVGLAAAGTLLAFASLGMGRDASWLAGYWAALLFGAAIVALGLWVALTAARLVTRRHLGPRKPTDHETDYADPSD